VGSFPDYGRLSGRSPDELVAGARIDVAPYKRDPGDFVLWKPSTPDQPGWDSPWGRGRPGWHIECSAMTLEHLGVPIDVHGGGKDLVFPHHTNEIAQSAAAVGDGRTAESFCRHWMHHGFVEIDSEKMSKSLGNFFTIREVIAKFDAEAVRLFLLGTHYRNPVNYTDGIVAEAERRLVYLYETLEKADRVAAGEAPAGEGALVERAFAALDDDFNTAQVLGILAEAFTEANALADRKGKKAPEERSRLAGFGRDARKVGSTLGILQRPPAQALPAIRDRAAARRGIDPSAVEERIAERAAARKAKDFARGDAIRGELAAMGVAIQDGPDGTTWKVE
ncbi:MAG TPA: DALR domain-containing protein, partial [Anaeromyxobacteraceae bacterium]|nr:DALR domain-containing protein [Anaeromyxobacteraceae bacterium]